MSRWSLSPIAAAENVDQLIAMMNTRIQELNLILSEIEQTDSKVDVLNSATPVPTKVEFDTLQKKVTHLQNTLKITGQVRV